MRTHGWWTVEPSEVRETVEAHGRLMLGDNGELMVEFTDQKAAMPLHPKRPLMPLHPHWQKDLRIRSSWRRDNDDSWYIALIS